MAFITLNKAHLFHNLDLLCSKAGGKEKVMAVLKDNAYGHGLEMMAQLVCEYGIRKVAVKNLLEARLIATLFDEVLVLVEHPTCKDIPSTVSLAAHSYDALERFEKGTSIHLALDTGMHRNGIKKEEIEKALKCIEQRGLKLKGVFTHFRSSDELNSEFFWQKRRFEESKTYIKTLYNGALAFHSCNSSGLLRCENLGDDAYARCGISLYGYTTLNPLLGMYDLKPVLALWAEKLSTRILKKGERVGYGGMYEASRDEVISTYDIGYGDGFFRFDGLKPIKMANGAMSKGRMSMDSFCLGGEDPKICMFEDANALAEHFHTISYEIITKLSPTLPRFVI
jgi:alanine racemase